MLSGVLRSDVAIQVSIRIMNTFVEMRSFIANNALLFAKVSDIELKQLEYQKVRINALTGVLQSRQYRDNGDGK